MYHASAGIGRQFRRWAAPSLRTDAAFTERGKELDEVIQFEPSLSQTESMLYLLLNALQSKQTQHQFEDPDAPQFTSSAEQLDDFESLKKAREEQNKAWLEYMRKRGRREPRPALSLSELWDALIGDEEFLEYHRVTVLEPIRRDPEDLYFEEFAISQRRINEQQSPNGWLPRSYFLAIPSTKVRFRCIVKEVTGRYFCTTGEHANCAVPKPDDFGVVRVSGIGVNFSTRERGPVIMHLYVPVQYGNWELIGRSDYPNDEKIVGYGEP
jgi:hypothetical protein